MIYLITPPEQEVKEQEIILPSSKSVSNRALLIRALAHSNATLSNVSDCNDTKVMLAALRDNPEVVDIGAAGTAMRFLTAYYALQEGETHILTGSKRMQERPIAPLVNALRELGAEITYEKNEGFPPLRIVGHKLKGGSIEVPGNISSQYISAILMIAPYLDEELELTLTGNIASLPYINMTIKMMCHFGADAGWSCRNTVYCKKKPYEVKDYTVEPDWSAASYWFEMLSLSGTGFPLLKSVRLPLLSYKSLQGDREIRDLLEKGLKMVSFDDKNHLLKANFRNPTTSLLRCDFTNIPDIAQTMVVACCMLDIPFLFYGLESLYIKETNRVEALKNELYKLGYDLRDDGKGTLMWQRGKHRRKVKPVIQTYEDHRMAMAFAPCCLKFDEIRIANPEVVSKSYPNFWEDLKSVGFRIDEIEE